MTTTTPTRNYWPLGITMAFVLLLAGITTAIYIAVTHQDSLVTPNYSESELKFQQQIDATARAQSCGATLAYLAGAGQIELAVPSAQLARNFSGNLVFYRPSSSDLDRQVPLKPAADGRQRLSVSDLKPGPWQVRASWQSDSVDYFLELEFVVSN